MPAKFKPLPKKLQGTTCDWGHCNLRAVKQRYTKEHGFLPVCEICALRSNPPRMTATVKVGGQCDAYVDVYLHHAQAGQQLQVRIFVAGKTDADTEHIYTAHIEVLA